ncbi:unnamed protein product [Rhodiola kirilowii]
MVVPHHPPEVAPLIGWYVITRMLKETVTAGVVTSSPTSSRSIHHYNPLPPLPQQQALNVLVDEQHNKPPSDSESD